MLERTVIKFGGTSNSDAEAVERCRELATDHLIQVTSAPGILNDKQLDDFVDMPPNVPAEFLREKVTDQLLIGRSLYVSEGEIPKHVLDSLLARYASIVNGLGITSLKGEWLNGIPWRTQTAIHSGEDYASMLGERLQSEIYEAMGRRLLDPSTSGLNLAATNKANWRHWLKDINPNQPSILPGNTWFDGERAYTFSRGGSDISGTLAAYAIRAYMNYNMSDTPAQSVNPRIITDPQRRRIIEHFTYEEGRELGRNGTGLLHPEAIVPLMGSGIPTTLGDTFDPKGPSTLYADEVDTEARTGRVIAISTIPDVLVVEVHEPGMSESAGRVAVLGTQLAKAHINAIDIVGHGSDRELFLVKEKAGSLAEQVLRSSVNSNATVSSEPCSLVTLVGYNLPRRALDIRVGLAQNAGLGKEYARGDHPPHWIEGKHSLRFTVAKDQMEAVVDRAHAYLVEDATHVRDRI
jgi:aspartate kinase